MEEPINPDLFVPFNGRRIYVCCETCLEKVREEPARYAQIVAQTVDPQEDEETAGAEEDKKDSAGAVEERPAQSTCPIMGFAVNKDLYADVKGKRVYVCCPPCRQKVKADPDAALKTIRKRGERAVDVPEGEGGGRDEAHER
jgi:YHS domain-containing protein